MKKALFIGLVWPEPTSSAAGWRMLQLLELFQQEYEVYFACAATQSEHSHDLKAIGIHERVILLNDSSFDDFLVDLQPDIVVFDRFMVEEQYGWRVAKSSPQAIRILDTEDLHFLRAARQEAYHKKVEINLHSDTAYREIAAIYRSDLSLIISEKEMSLLKDTFHIPDVILCFLPFLEKQLPEDYQDSTPGYSERKDFIFMGNFIHEPNWRTVEILKRDIWPVLRKRLPDTQLHIYGSYVPEKARQMHKPQENFHVMGRATDARMTFQRYKVLIAPIPIGAGLKGKFVDAMHSGTPSVTTSIGAEGMLQNGGWNGFISDQPEVFIDKAVILYKDQEIWEKAVAQGIAMFNQCFATSVYRESFFKQVNIMEDNLISHRQNNFIGQLLQHHTNQSTKYMSLWIEEKNKAR